MTYEDWKRLLVDIPLPAAFVDLDAFDRNIDHFLQLRQRLAAQHSIRLATKSVRVPSLIQRVVDRGHPFRGLMCYAASEAWFLAEQGFDDLLLAYPTRQPADVALLRRIHDAGKCVRLVVDSLAAAEWVSQNMLGVSRPFELVLDVDMSYRLAAGRLHLGVRRSPVRTIGQVLQFLRAVDRLPSVRCRSLMAYEAQVAGLPDRNPFRKPEAPLARVIRRRCASQVAQRRRSLADTLQDEGFALELFNGGGSGSVDTALAEPWLTEVTVGSGLLCSHLFSYYSNIAPQPACFFALPVVRASDPRYVTCAGGGYVASGEPGWDKVPLPCLPERVKLVRREGCGEVQTPLVLPTGLQSGTRRSGDLPPRQSR